MDRNKKKFPIGTLVSYIKNFELFPSGRTPFPKKLMGIVMGYDESIKYGKGPHLILLTNRGEEIIESKRCKSIQKLYVKYKE